MREPERAISVILQDGRTTTPISKRSSVCYAISRQQTQKVRMFLDRDGHDTEERQMEHALITRQDTAIATVQAPFF